MEEAASWKVESEIEKWEKQRVDKWRVKQVDKLMQKVKLVPFKISLIRVQTDVVVPAVPVVIEGATRASYISVVS